MRIISQDGTTDVPYEKSILALSDNGKVGVYTNGQFISLATYSSLDKAAKAMEGCRAEYKKVIGVVGSVYEYPKVFQFPKDEEVEV